MDQGVKVKVFAVCSAVVIDFDHCICRFDSHSAHIHAVNVCLSISVCCQYNVCTNVSRRSCAVVYCDALSIQTDVAESDVFIRQFNCFSLVIHAERFCLHALRLTIVSVSYIFLVVFPLNVYQFSNYCERSCDRYCVVDLSRFCTCNIRIVSDQCHLSVSADLYAVACHEVFAVSLDHVAVDVYTDDQVC